MGERVVVGCVNEHDRYLLALSPQDLSETPQSNLHLFFLPKDSVIDVRSCRGLLCFNYYGDGRAVLCNPTTRQLKLLPPTPRPRPRALVRLQFNVCGFGYDSQSDDYKVIRAYTIFHYELDYFGHKILRDSKNKFQLYSLRRNSWREIPGPGSEFILTPEEGTALVKARVYWVAYVDHGKRVLAFDFATETCSSFSVPPPLDGDTRFYAVNIDEESLGVVLYSRDKGFKSFEIWVWTKENKSWSRLYDRFVVDDVEGPVGLRDGRLLFLERERKSPPFQFAPPRKQLVVYDLVEKRLKEFDICDCGFGSFTINSYVESRVALPNSMPIDDKASWKDYWSRWEADHNGRSINNGRQRYIFRRRYSSGERRESEREGRRCVWRDRGRERVRAR